MKSTGYYTRARSFCGNIDIKLLEQSRIFHDLENGLPISISPTYGNLVHFQEAHLIPVQRWFPYREGFSTRLVHTFISDLNIKGNVFDPFSGSGTTLLAARHSNLNSYGIDVNPISILVSRVENSTYNNSEVLLFEEETNNFNTISRIDSDFTTPFALSEKVFNNQILQALLQLKIYIMNLGDAKVRDLFFVAWLSIIESVSNIKKEGNGIKYKNRKRTPTGYINIDKGEWEDKVFPKDKFSYVVMAMQNQLNVMLDDIKNNYGNSIMQPHIFQGSCLDFEKYFSDEIQFTFFSPPYCNCFDYFEIHKVELWLGEFVRSMDELKLLRNTGFRSNTNSLNHKPILYQNEHLEKLVKLLDISKLWSKKIPNVIQGYFDDTNNLLKKLYRHTINNGYVGIVVGNSAYSSVIIPTDILVAHIAKENGFKIKNIFITRHLTTSSQQKQQLDGLKDYLRESIVLLQK